MMMILSRLSLCARDSIAFISLWLICEMRVNVNKGASTRFSSTPLSSRMTLFCLRRVWWRQKIKKSGEIIMSVNFNFFRVNVRQTISSLTTNSDWENDRRQLAATFALRSQTAKNVMQTNTIAIEDELRATSNCTIRDVVVALLERVLFANQMAPLISAEEQKENRRTSCRRLFTSLSLTPSCILCACFVAHYGIVRRRQNNWNQNNRTLRYAMTMSFIFNRTATHSSSFAVRFEHRLTCLSRFHSNSILVASIAIDLFLLHTKFCFIFSLFLSVELNAKRKNNWWTSVIVH